MSNLHTLEQFQKIVDKNLREIKVGPIEENIPAMISMLATTIKSERPYEEFLDLETIGDWQSFTGSVGYGSMSPGYYRRIEPGEKALALEFERKLIDDDQFGVIEDKIGMLEHSRKRTEEKAFSRLFGNAASAAFDFETSEEGVSLCNSSHKTKVVGVSTTTGFSNIGSTALSKTAIAAARYTMSRFKTGIGELANIHGDTIICPTALFDTACEATGYDPRSGADSDMDPDTANRKINVARGIKVIPWDYLDNFSSSAWFMVDFALMKKHLLWIDRIGPDYNSWAEQETFSVKVSGYRRYGCGPRAWQPIYMGNQ